jgi:hypothetical protein
MGGRMIRLKLIAIVPFIAFANTSHAHDFSIKGHGIGLTIEEFSKISSAYTCRPNAEGLISCFGSSPITIGGQTIESAIVKFDKKEKSNHILFSFDSEYFDDIKTAISSKYRSLKCTKSLVENRFSAKFINETCSASTKYEVLSVEKYSSSISKGVLSITSSEALSDFAKQRHEKAKDI